jgi:hypothetical protein
MATEGRFQGKNEDYVAVAKKSLLKGDARGQGFLRIQTEPA